MFNCNKFVLVVFLVVFGFFLIGCGGGSGLFDSIINLLLLIIFELFWMVGVFVLLSEFKN